MQQKNDAFYIHHAIKSGWSQRYLFISDIHYDAKNCDRKLLKKVLDEALEHNARIMIFGDLFDAMGGKFDKRTGKGDIRPEYNTGTYFTDIVNDAAKFFKPYAHLIELIADGNHETSVKARHEIDILDDLRLRLDPTEQQILRGKYAGFIRFYFANDNKGVKSSKTLYYNHGGGGNSPVTVGVIKSNRRQEAVQADYYVSGHIHTEFEVPRTQVRLNHDLVAVVEKVKHFQLGCFKNDFLSGGWADHKEFRAANLGGRWLEFRYDRSKPGRIDERSWIAD